MNPPDDPINLSSEGEDFVRSGQTFPNQPSEIPMDNNPTAQSPDGTPFHNHIMNRDKGKGAIDVGLSNGKHSTKIQKGPFSLDVQYAQSDSLEQESTPKNTIGSDLDSILANPNIDLAALTVFDNPPESSVKASKKDSNFRGRSKLTKEKFRSISLLDGNEDNLADIPISISDGNWTASRALRARSPAEDLQ